MMTKRILVVFSIVMCGTISLTAQTRTRDVKKEHDIEEQLRIVNPLLVPNFQTATKALDSGNFVQAESLYAEVYKYAPSFDPAIRRLGSIRVQLGKIREGISLSEKAVSMNRSPANLFTLAECLAFPAGHKTGSRDDLNRALGLLEEAEQQSGGDDEDILTLIAQLALQLDLKVFRNATRDLVRHYPDLMFTHYCSAVLAATDEHWLRAEEEILTAEKLGLPHEAAQSFLDSGVHSNATIWRYVSYSLWIAGAWILGLLLLYAIGKLLSDVTIRSVVSSNQNVTISYAGKVLRRIYRMLINYAGLYYYVSLPVVVVIVILLAVGVFYLFWIIGRLPIKLLLIVGIGATVTIYKMIQSLFIKVRHEEPGRVLQHEEAPGLWDLTQDVARILDTRPIDEIRITPTTELAVYERGTWRDKMRDSASRILILGVANFKNFRQDDFRAVLAHEYGHFSHRDTAGGDVALRVQSDMNKFFYALYFAGQATKWNVAVHFLRMYDFIFRRITHGATRLQEILADRVAAQQFGVQAFTNGLTHVILRGVEFNQLAGKEVEDALKKKRPFHNLYELPELPTNILDNELKTELNCETSEDDTHPSPADRFRLLADVHSSASDCSQKLVWELFANKSALTKEMTSLVEANAKKAT